MEKHFPKWTRYVVIGLPNWQWIGLFVSILLGLMIRFVTQRLHSVVKKLAHLSDLSWGKKAVLAVERPLGWVTASGFWFFCLHLLMLEGVALSFLTLLVQFIFFVAVIASVYRLSDVITEYLGNFARKTEIIVDDDIVPLVNRALKIFIVVFGALVLLQNMGINVMSVLAGLGLGGLAFALAAKDTCANLFGSIMILIDRPFRIGDWIIVSGQEGTVEDIGFRSTRMRTFYNSVVSLPNSVVANAHIDNMGQREFRRIRTNISVTYDTPPLKIERFSAGIKDIVSNHPHTRKDTFHVVFNEFASSSLDILFYVFVKVSSWEMELKAKQEMYLDIVRLAEKLEINFAFPTQTVHVESLPSSSLESPR